MSEPGSELQVPNNHIKRSSRSLACRSTGNSPTTNLSVSRKAFAVTQPCQPATETADLNNTNVEIDVTNITRNSSKTPTKPAKTQLGKCPCRQSNESSWKLKCTACKQIWHTDCVNLKTACAIPESVILSLEKSWTCPWCFRTPILRPPGHPSCTNENQLIGTVIADSVCEKVREDISHNLLPEFQLSVDNLIKLRLKEVSETVEAQVNSIKEDMKDLAELKSKLLASDITEHPTANPCPIPRISPLVINPTSHIKEYRENFLSADETTELKTMLEALPFSTVSGRSVASFGEEYHYNGAPKSNSSDIPNPIKSIIKKIHDDPLYSDEKINQVVINKYNRNAHLPEHSDNESTVRPHSNIFTVTIGHALPIVFRNKVTQEDSTLEPAEGSLYAMSMESQHHWSHRIDMADLIDASRYSITFRSVGKNYKNSTIIIGDSNTKHLKFSTGQHREMGTFGYNMPGERVETFHISQIDERKCLGYRNIVIHCGINDIRDNSPGRQMSDPQPTEVKEHFNNLIQKIENIKNMCPNSSIVVNPLLPTKSQNLNQRVLKFNSLLFEFLANDIRGEGVRSTNFREFVDHEHGVLKEEYGVWDTKSNNYSKRDILHMGKLGIRLLARIIRDSVYTKLVTSRSYSSTLTHQSRSQGGLSR